VRKGKNNLGKISPHNNQDHAFNLEQYKIINKNIYSLNHPQNHCHLFVSLFANKEPGTMSSDGL
jgi:hypothetical protein